MQRTTTHRRTAAGLALTVALAAPGAAHAMASQAEGAQGGLSWLDLAIALGILASIVLLGLWGDVVVGTVIASLWTVVEVTIKVGAIALRPPTFSLGATRLRSPKRGIKRAERPHHPDPGPDVRSASAGEGVVVRIARARRP